MNNKAAKGTWAAAFTVASVWFGTHVGGGFASGNQVVSYFAQYGMWAAVLPLVAMGILALVMYTVMKFAKLNGFTNYKDTFSALYPKPWMEVFFEIFYIVILLAAVAAAVFHRSFHRNSYLHRSRRYRRLCSRLRRNQRKPACSEQYHGSTVC